MTTPHAPDDERLPGEDELSSLYRKLPSIEPPAALDAAVRQAAVEAVKPAVAIRRRARWPVALSSAAALVVAAGLAWRMGQMPGKQDELREVAKQHEAQTITAQEPAAAQPMAAPQLQARIVEPPKQAPPPPASPRRVIAQAKRMQTAPAPPPTVEEASSNGQLAMPAAPAPPAPPSPPVQSAGRAAQADSLSSYSSSSL
jgi:Meckel syndrome type 1 protein